MLPVPVFPTICSGVMQTEREEMGGKFYKRNGPRRNRVKRVKPCSDISFVF